MRDDFDDDDFDDAPRQPRHSGVGVASFVLAIVAAVVLMIDIVVIVSMQFHNPRRGRESEMIVGLVILACVVLQLLALGLGIGGLLQRDRKKVFAILGVCFSAVPLLGEACLMLIGLAARH